MAEIKFKDVVLKYRKSKYPLKAGWYKDKLLELGFSQIGNGKYSSVFHRNSDDFVIKINRIPDPANTLFVKKCSEISNKYFPVIFQINTVKSLDDDEEEFDQNIIFMEKLNPIHYKEGIKLSNKIVEIIYDIMADREASVEVDDDLNSACNHIVELQKNYYIDIHEDNVMYRGTDQLVITDPIQ